MKVERLNADFGNSTNNFLIDSYYFEFPTCVAEISKEKAESHFTNTVDDVEDLLDRLLISTVIEDQERFFMVGKLAEDNPYSNSHVGKMHDKINSDLPYAVFLAAMAYYYKVKNEDGENVATIEIESKKMMLPIWLLKKEDKFSIGQSKMANRFIGEHKVTLMTSGMETDLTINVTNSKCYIESEIARWAIKYKMAKTVESENSVTKIEKRPEAKKFDNFETVLVDIGGGSTDAVILPKGLNTPVSKDSFQVIQIEPYLGRLEVLLKEKLIEHFSDLRSLEKFIVANYKSQKYILKNPNTGHKSDLTEPIVEMLREYAKLLVFKVMEPFSSNSKGVLKYIYFGGEAPILAPYIKESVIKHTNEEILENNHFFLNELLEDDHSEIFKPTARTINLAALEILSLNERKSN
jgi:plasmid segregation protein ParM